MGCFYCNLRTISANMDIKDTKFPEMTKKLEKLSSDPEFQKDFLHDLSYDIAYCHPEVIKQIMIYKKQKNRQKKEEVLLQKGSVYLSLIPTKLEKEAFS